MLEKIVADDHPEKASERWRKSNGSTHREPRTAEHPEETITRNRFGRFQKERQYKLMAKLETRVQYRYILLAGSAGDDGELIKGNTYVDYSVIIYEKEDETMVYVTVKQSPKYHQMTLEEFLFGTEPKNMMIDPNTTNTRTYVTKHVNNKLLDRINVFGLIQSLQEFNEMAGNIHNRQRETLYNTFYIAKKGKGMPYIFKKIFAMQSKYIECDSSAVFREVASKVREMTSQHPTEDDEKITRSIVSHCTKYLVENGFHMTEDKLESIIKESHRRIDAPKDELKGVLYRLKSIFEDQFGALYHTSAFAYIKNRSTLDAVKRHQSNESKWFGKYDLANFFGSTTVDFIMRMFSMIFPFSEVVKYSIGKDELQKALSLCVLKGVLPQGTPISPLITNIMMIPIDHKLSNGLRNFHSQQFVYTRYADDFLISSKCDFDFREVEHFLSDTLDEFGAPFTIKSEKTRYGSSAGSNWNLGVMLNKD